MSEPTNPAVVLAMIQRTCLVHLRFATLLSVMCTVMYIDRSIQINMYIDEASMERESLHSGPAEKASCGL